MANVMGMQMPEFAMAHPHGGMDGPQKKNNQQDEGRIFMGGLSHATTKASIEAYCRQWCVPLLAFAAARTCFFLAHPLPTWPFIPSLLFIEQEFSIRYARPGDSS